MPGDIPDRPDVTNQSPRGTVRVVQERNQNFIDREPVVVSDDYAEADLEARADAAWGAPLDVMGFDVVQLLVEFVKGSATGLGIAVQASYCDSRVDAVWYDDRATQSVREGGGTRAIPTDAANDLTFAFGMETSGKFVVEIRCRGNFMRFKPYFDGVAAADSRCTLKAIRLQTAS